MTLSENLIIAFGVMNVVLAILVLYAISLVVKLTRMTSKDEVENISPQNALQSNLSNNTTSQVPMQTFGDIDEEDKLVLALAASALASDNRSNSHFHISKITRIK